MPEAESFLDLPYHGRDGDTGRVEDKVEGAEVEDVEGVELFISAHVRADALLVEPHETAKTSSGMEFIRSSFLARQRPARAFFWGNL